jgi:hypothetical protein
MPDKWLQMSLDASLLRCQVARHYDVWMLVCLDARMLECKDTRMLECCYNDARARLLGGQASRMLDNFALFNIKSSKGKRKL